MRVSPQISDRGLRKTLSVIQRMENRITHFTVSHGGSEYRRGWRPHVPAAGLSLQLDTERPSSSSLGEYCLNPVFALMRRGHMLRASVGV